MIVTTRSGWNQQVATLTSVRSRLKTIYDRWPDGVEKIDLLNAIVSVENLTRKAREHAAEKAGAAKPR